MYIILATAFYSHGTTVSRFLPGGLYAEITAHSWQATVGVTRLEAYRRPHVAVLSTGNEVGPYSIMLCVYRIVLLLFSCTYL